MEVSEKHMQACLSNVHLFKFMLMHIFQKAWDLLE